MVTLGYDCDLIRELKHNWTIGLDADVTIASLNQETFWDSFRDSKDSKSLYNMFDDKLGISYYINKKREEGWKTRIYEEEYVAYGRDLDIVLTNEDIIEIITKDYINLLQNRTKTFTDLPTFSDTMLELQATAYYNKISSINSNITLDMVKTSYGFWPKEIQICKHWQIALDDTVILFQIDQFYKIDSSTSYYECFVNQLGTLNINSRLRIGNYAIEIEERNDLRGRTLKVARLKTYTTEDSSIYTIFMNFLAASLNAR